MAERGFQRKSKAAMEIPTSSLADMAFLLLIFFMVSTTFPSERPRKLPFPEAEATRKLDSARRDILHLYLERDGRVFINDANIPVEDVSGYVAPLYAANRALIVMIRADENVAYSYVDAVEKELQQAGAVRVTFYTNLERRINRERR
jgi:biopolymer transport protein ExbD